MRSLMLPAALLLAGCGPEGVPSSRHKDPDPPATAIELKPVTVKQLDEFIAAQKGKVVLIDCWSIS